MNTRKYIATFVASTFAVFALVTSFNYYVDPFTYYHSPWTDINLSKNQRYANPGLVRNYDYDLAVVGTSHVMEISSSRLSQITAVRSINLPFTAGLIRELAALVRLLVNEEKAGTIMLEMNFPSFSLGDVVSDHPDEFPMFLYQPRMEMPFRYLMSFDTLRTSIAALDKPGQVTLDNKDDIGERQYGRDRVVSVWNYQTRTWDQKRLDFWARHQHEIKKPAEIMEARLLPLFEAHPGVDFELFLPPNSILFFLHHASLSANDFERWLSFRNMLGELAERFEHVRLHDLQTDFQTMTNLDNYRDMGHYNPQILQRLFETIVAGEALVDVETVTRNSIELRRTVVKFGQGFCRQQDVECSENLRAWLNSRDPAR